MWLLSQRGITPGNTLYSFSFAIIYAVNFSGFHGGFNQMMDGVRVLYHVVV